MAFTLFPLYFGLASGGLFIHESKHGRFLGLTAIGGKALGACIAACALSLPAIAAAQAQVPMLVGKKTLSAVTRDGSVIAIGSVTLVPVEPGVVKFTVQMQHDKFTDHFLSMKEFKCLDSPVEVSCHVPYPYAQPQTIKGQDFAWLEHSLLFLFKQPRDFGAKLWNGSYYRFEQHGNRLLGRPQAIDLNHISAPPDNLTVPPYSTDLRSDNPPGARWIDQLVIE